MTNNKVCFNRCQLLLFQWNLCRNEWPYTADFASFAVAQQSNDSDAIFCHLAPYMLYAISYSCGPDINVCCQFDFMRKKCWRLGGYQDPEPVLPENIESKYSCIFDLYIKQIYLQ
jgi:hypothetical protein